MNEILHTKFGKAKIDDDGYYIIISYKEGNRHKRLHRLIYEDFYGCKIPKGYQIHHKNGNKLDNCILNLQLIKPSEHTRLHNGNQKGENNYNYKGYFTLVKGSFTSAGNRRYCIYKNSKYYKGSTDKEKLIDWFYSNYPNEYLKIP